MLWHLIDRRLHRMDTKVAQMLRIRFIVLFTTTPVILYTDQMSRNRFIRRRE